MATAGAKVSIGCKIAVAWIDLEINEERTLMEDTRTGPREVKVFAHTGDVVRIRGTAYPRGTPPEGFMRPPMMINGYAVTPNVSKEWWEKWKAQRARDPMVINNMIVAFDTADAAKGVTKDYVGELSGLEPVNPISDARMPKPTIKGVEVLTTEEGRRESVARAVEAASA